MSETTRKRGKKGEKIDNNMEEFRLLDFFYCCRARERERQRQRDISRGWLDVKGFNATRLAGKKKVVG
jgi:hypothetical protein